MASRGGKSFFKFGMGHMRRLVRRFCGGIKNDRWVRGERRMAHLLAVPQLAAPTAAFGIDDAGAAAAAAWVFAHWELPVVASICFASISPEAARW